MFGFGLVACYRLNRVINMNYFLLIAGDNQYPQAYTEDWIGCYPSFDDAKAAVTFLADKRLLIKGAKYDWFDIVDLREWITGKQQ